MCSPPFVFYFILCSIFDRGRCQGCRVKEENSTKEEGVQPQGPTVRNGSGAGGGGISRCVLGAFAR